MRRGNSSASQSSNAQRVEDGLVKVVHVHLVLLRAQADRVGCAVGHATAHTGAGQPDGVAPRVVVAAGALFAHRHAANLTAPDDERVAQQSTCLEVGQQPGDRQVGSTAILRVVFEDVGMGIPAAGVAGVKLHETHAFLDHPPREQAACAELGRFLLADSVQPARGLALAGDVDDLGRGRLHAKRQLVGIHTGGEPIVKVARCKVVAVEFADEIKHPALAATANVGRRLEV